MDGGEETDGEEQGLVDDEWKRVPGGPFVARLLCKSRQPVAHASYRNFNVAVPIDPLEGPLEPGGEIRFPVVPGAPADGIVCKLPESWGADKQVLDFKLKLSKLGATESTVTIASAFHRHPRDEEDEEAEAEAEVGAEAEAEAEAEA